MDYLEMTEARVHAYIYVCDESLLIENLGVLTFVDLPPNKTSIY